MQQKRGERRKYNVLVVDDNDAVLKHFQAFLHLQFPDVPIDTSILKVKPNDTLQTVRDRILSVQPDMLSIDQYLGTGEMRGTDVAGVVREAFTRQWVQQFPIIGITAHLIPDRKDIDFRAPSPVEREFYRALDARVLDATCKKPENPEGYRLLAEKMRPHMIKPFRIGIYGMSETGIGFVNECTTHDFFSEIWIGSDRTPLRKTKRKGKSREDKPSAEDLIEPDPRIRIAQSLEEMLARVDFIVFTSSTKRGREYPGIVKSYDRKEIFPFETEKYGRYGTIVARSEFDGFICILANPPAHLEEYFIRLGVNPFSFITPYLPDIGRLTSLSKINFLNYVHKLCREKRVDYESDLGLYNEFLAETPQHSFGIHGFTRRAIREYYRARLKECDFKWIHDSEEESDEIGKRSIDAAVKLSKPFRGPRDVAGFLRQIACYQQPEENCIAHYEDANRRGSCSMPVSVNYRYCTAVLNTQLLQHIGIEEFHGISDRILADQQRFLNEVLRTAA